MRTRYSIPRITSSATTTRSSTTTRGNGTSQKIPIMPKDRKNTLKCQKRNLLRMLLERSCRLCRIKNLQRNNPPNRAPKRRQLLLQRSLSQLLPQRSLSQLLLLYLLQLQLQPRHQLQLLHRQRHQYLPLHQLKRRQRFLLRPSMKPCLMPLGIIMNQYLCTTTNKWYMNSP